MIQDRIENASRHLALHPRLKTAFEYLAKTDLTALADGRYEIDGLSVYLVLAHAAGVGRRAARLEAHRRYVDIQVPLDAAETMGWRQRSQCQTVSQAYDETDDIEFFSDPPARWITVAPGGFVVFFPDDAHAPLACDGVIHKGVFKLAVD